MEEALDLRQSLVDADADDEGQHSWLGDRIPPMIIKPWDETMKHGLYGAHCLSCLFQGQMNIHFSIQCAVWLILEANKKSSATHLGLLNSSGFSGFHWEGGKSGPQEGVWADDVLGTGKLSSFGVKADEGSGPELWGPVLGCLLKWRFPSMGVPQ